MDLALNNLQIYIKPNQTKASQLDLVMCHTQENCCGESYASAEEHSTYFIAPADWVL